jgi:predicted DNA-binding protein YlxM (UPF0122 family)
MNDIETSIILSWLDNKSIEQIAKELDIYQSQVAETLNNIVHRFETVESTVKLLDELGLTEKMLKRLNQIPKTYKTDKYDY